MVWSALPATGVQLRTVLMHSHTAHMPQSMMCSLVVNSQKVAKLACIMLKNVIQYLKSVKHYCPSTVLIYFIIKKWT